MLWGLLLVGTAFAQDGTDADGAAPAEEETADTDDGSDAVEETGGDTDETSGAVEEDEETAEDGESEEMELDYSALGEMDPEQEMSGAGKAKEAVGPGEDWTQRNMELFEVHGNFRVRPGLYHKFYIRNDNSLFPVPADRKAGCSKDDKCATLAGADMRFLLAPTINLSEEVRVNAELIFFNNMMMGSTPASAVDPDAGTAATGAMTGYSQEGPTGDFFLMNRAWGEMEAALGHLRFGRMPSHWGTGMLYHSGDGINDDYGDTVDRISFAFKLNGWLIMPAFDFPSEGLSLNSAAGRPFDVSQLDDAYQLVGVVAYQHEPEDQRAMLKRGDLVINTGLHFSYRAQAMQFDWTSEDDPDYDGEIENQISTYKRDMWGITPDIWFQLLYDTFHLELELAFHVGEVGEPSSTSVDMRALSLFSWGAVLQADYGLLSDQLRIGIEFGIASGDKDVEGLSAPASFDQLNGESSRFSVFSFNPGYSVDFILYRHILGSVSGSYYFKPWLRYDFLKAAMGKKFGVQLDVLFARAFYEASTISNSSGNLGVELDARVDFATSDNFVAALKYGVLFPLNGFKGTHEWEDATGAARTYRDTDLSIPQTLQLLLGITF